MGRKSIDDVTKRRGQALIKRIKEAREGCGMSQEELAKTINVSTDTIRALEQEKTLVPGVFLAADLAKALMADLSDWVNAPQRRKMGK